MNKSRKLAHFLMILLVISWGLEYVLAKNALEVLPTMVLIFMKYFVAFFIVFAIKMKMDPGHWIRKKDIPIFIICSLTGEILYFLCEYGAMSYMPVSLITVMLAFVPVISVIIETLVYKRKPNSQMVIAIIVGIVGIGLIIGVDFKEILGGEFIGYLLCLGAVFSWNIYNFITASLGDKYSSITLTFNQLVCTLLLTAPYALTHLPSISVITTPVIWQVVYLGVVSGGFGFFIMVYALSVLGPTPNAVYSNFLPVTSTIFAWVFLGEKLGWLQILGGIIVISAGYIVIKEKGKLEERNSD